MELSRPEYWSGQPFPSLGYLPNPGIEPRSLTLQADSLPAEPQGKPKNAGVGSLYVLQRIFPTQKLSYKVETFYILNMNNKDSSFCTSSTAFAFIYLFLQL